MLGQVLIVLVVPLAAFARVSLLRQRKPAPFDCRSSSSLLLDIPANKRFERSRSLILHLPLPPLLPPSPHLRLIQYMEAEERLKEFVDEQTREALRQRALKKQGILNAPPAIGAFDQIKHDETEARLKNKIADICARIGGMGFVLFV